MKNKKRIFFISQFVCGILITILFFSAAYYFPNLPPFVRGFVPKGAKGSVRVFDNTNTDKIDPRFLSWFDRDPERNIPKDKNIIVSPADGYVESVREVDDMKHLIIEMRYSDVHVQRVPMAGTVISVEGEGKELPKEYESGDYMQKKLMPFQKITTFRTEIGTIKVHQITSYFAKRILVYPKTGDTVERGQRLGKVIAGSTVVIEMPKNVRILVKEKQDVFGGETIIASY